MSIPRIPLELIKEYNRKRDIKEYLLGIQKNLGNNIRINEIITKLNMDLIVLENKFTNDDTEQ